MSHIGEITRNELLELCAVAVGFVSLVGCLGLSLICAVEALYKLFRKMRINRQFPEKLNEELLQLYKETNKELYYEAYKSGDLMFKRHALY